LNLIEILWKKIKYEWLPFSSYSTCGNLKQLVPAILDGFDRSTRFNIRSYLVLYVWLIKIA
jgi:hypothetical protein